MTPARSTAAPRARVARTLRRAGAALVAALLFVGILATPAFAHAELQGTDPSANDVVARPPDAITLRFTEGVDVALGGIRVYDSRGHRVEIGAPKHPDGNTSQVRVSLPTLERDTYVVTWRVTSEDSHPVRGAFVFSVGSAVVSGENARGLASQILASQGGSNEVGVVFAIVRFAVFLGIALLVGGVGFLVAVWRQGRDSTVARRVLWGGFWLVLVATVLGFMLQGPYSAGLGLADIFKPSLWSDVAKTRFGRVWLGRAALLVVAAPLVGMLVPRRGPAAEHPLPRWWGPATAVAGAVLVTTPGLSGHASSGPLVALALPADAAHVAAMSLWLGGLVMLFAALLPRADSATLRAAVPRYSQLALMSVALVVVTGVFQSFRQVDRIGALLDTDYGSMLLIKIIVFSVLMVVAALSRDVVNRRWRIPEDDLVSAPAAVAAGAGDAGRAGAVATLERPSGTGGDGSLATDDEPYPEGFVLDEGTARRRLRRALVVEVVIAAAILTVTALLVNAAPVRGLDSGPFTGTVNTGPIAVDTVLTPAKQGSNQLHLYGLTEAGAPADVIEMTAQLSQPARDIAPIDIKLLRAGPGHYTSTGFTVPITGAWKLTIRVRATDVDEYTGTATVTIR